MTKKLTKFKKRVIKKTKVSKIFKKRKPNLGFHKKSLLQQQKINLKNTEKPNSPKAKIQNQVSRTKIKVIGVGGGGNSIVSEIGRCHAKIWSGAKKVDFVAINTDLQALNRVSKECKAVRIGQTLTAGLGCGMNPELGRRSASQSKEELKKILEGSDFCILIACLGGGAGSGIAPVIAEICKNLKKVSLGIFTLPFKFEGEKKWQIAKNSLKKMTPNLNVVNIIPNEKIFQIINPTTPLKAALSVINQRLAFTLEGLIGMIYDVGLINIDWADFKTILEGRGKRCYLNRTSFQGEDRAILAAREVVQNPLNEYGPEGANRILFNIEGNKDLKMQEIGQISKFIFNFNKRAKIIFGISLPRSILTKSGSPRGLSKPENNKIGITLLATGAEKTLGKTPDFNKREMLLEKSHVLPPRLKNKKPKVKRVKPILAQIENLKRKPNESPYSRAKLGTGRLARGENRPLPTQALKKLGVEKEAKSERKKTSPKKKIYFRKSEKESRELSAETSPAPEVTRPKKEEIKEKTTVLQSLSSLKKNQKGAGKPTQVLQNKTWAGKSSSNPKPPGENSLPRGKPIRKNALALRKDTEKAEKEILAAEKKWDFPSFLRKK